MRNKTKLTLVAVVATLVGGGIGAAFHFLPSFVTTRHSYCTVCALHHEESEQISIFGRKVTTNDRGAVLHRLLAKEVGPHEHVFIAPAAFVRPTMPSRRSSARSEFGQAVSEAEVADLEALEESPHLLALLDEAMRQDRDRTIMLVHRVLDPKAFVGIDAIALLDRPTSWENRFAVVDAFFELYRCTPNEVSVSCHMRMGATDLMVLVRTATSLHQGGVDFAHWVPPGMKPPPGVPAPSTYAAVTLTD